MNICLCHAPLTILKGESSHLFIPNWEIALSWAKQESPDLRGNDNYVLQSVARGVPSVQEGNALTL